MGEASKEVVARHFTYSETAKCLPVLSIWAYVIVVREIVMCMGEIYFRYEWCSRFVTEGRRQKK
jgi:hypothetical protein